ncbi:hypothetical protein [Sorangium sp. So ce1182]|uniref:hypothetical protein n=1 Tax=Sorangium sp. So ce1182 TaxID=3133334 RepID=UPI003F6132E8
MVLSSGETDVSPSLLVAPALSSLREAASPALTPPVLDERAFLVAESSELPESPHRAPILAGVAVAMSNGRA